MKMEEIRKSFFSMFRLVNPKNKYDPIKVALLYHVIGEALIKQPILIGKNLIDMRFSFGCCIQSGFGKEAIRSVVQKCADEGQFKSSSFTSLNEEQLVGKKWQDKEAKEDKLVLGYFADDFIIKDDALSFINNPKYETARNYFLNALDSYGKNRIQKRLVEEEEGLNYLAMCSLLFFIQPNEKIKPQNISSGLFRRAPILRVNITKEDAEEILEKNTSEDFEENPNDFLEFIRGLRILRISYREISKELLDNINTNSKELYSDDVLLKCLYLINKNNIIKWSYINSLIRENKKSLGKNPYNPKSLNSEIELEVTKEDVEQAIGDYLLVYDAIFTFVEENTGSFKTIENLKDVIIQKLRKEKCFSEKDSKYSSSQLIEEISKNYNLKIDTVKYHFYELKRKGKIQTKQIGQNDSRVWVE